MARLRDAVATVAAAEDAGHLQREGVEVVSGWATLSAPGRLEIDGRTVAAPRLVLATGGRPAVPSVPGLDQVEYLTNESVFEIEELPPSLAVLGGGAIGCELAQAFARMGTRVTVVEALPRLLPREEPEASAVVRGALVADSVSVFTGQPVVRVEPLEAKGSARLHLEDGTLVEATRMLVAVGRRPSTEGLGLQAAAVEVDGRGFIRTDERLATTARGVFAVGDVTGKAQLTHAADEMGRIAVSNALRPWRRRRFRPGLLPVVTFTDPEVAHVGMTEADAAAVGGRVATVAMSEVDRAIAAGRTEGFVKLVVGSRPVLGGLGGGRVLGATVVAPPVPVR